MNAGRHAAPARRAPAGGPGRALALGGPPLYVFVMAPDVLRPQVTAVGYVLLNLLFDWALLAALSGITRFWERRPLASHGLPPLAWHGALLAAGYGVLLGGAPPWPPGAGA